MWRRARPQLRRPASAFCYHYCGLFVDTLGLVTLLEQSPPPARPVSFADLYAEHGPRVLRLLKRLGILDADREDIAREVWAVAYRSLTNPAAEEPAAGKKPKTPT